MTALAAANEVQEKASELLDHPVGVDIIYRGALVKYNAAGFLMPCAAEAGGVFAGIAYETVDNSGGSAGDLSCKVMKKGLFLLTGSFAQTDVGQKVYASDDQTISKTQASNEQQVGRVEVLESSTQVWVDIKPII